MVPVTKAFFPPIDEYQKHLQRIWDNQWLTNRGELVEELEHRLKDYLHISNITLTTNGTLPIQMALNIMANQGEVITTPFSYVATASAIVWEHCKPVFVDIHPEYLTIDENLIEAAITSKTTAILATHVFGNPCNVEIIENIANKHNLKVIYDAAHCFGVKYKNESIFNHGDVSTCSFHATKLFHTAEGGAFICNDKDLNHRLFYSHKFGHNGPIDFHGVGINAKMSELQAAMGLSVFPYIDEIIKKRKKIVDWYNKYLDPAQFQKLKIREHTEWNYSYYPIILEHENALLEKVEILNKEQIYPRRYFYPSLNKLNYVASKKKEISESIASRILCLPLFAEIEEKTVMRIAKLMNNL
ncbi:DegT/DnrJ/EryC1/StrS family aminotransferase [Salegentibacter echinorum]|nr:DegT/DnrJ/EryC1/StrS family aminotransferase [Salegentibacter echinorum]